MTTAEITMIGDGTAATMMTTTEAVAPVQIAVLAVATTSTIGTTAAANPKPLSGQHRFQRLARMRSQSHHRFGRSSGHHLPTAIAAVWP